MFWRELLRAILVITALSLVSAQVFEPLVWSDICWGYTPLQRICVDKCPSYGTAEQANRCVDKVGPCQCYTCGNIVPADVTNITQTSNPYFTWTPYNCSKSSPAGQWVAKPPGWQGYDWDFMGLPYLTTNSLNGTRACCLRKLCGDTQPGSNPPVPFPCAQNSVYVAGNASAFNPSQSRCCLTMTCSNTVPTTTPAVGFACALGSQDNPAAAGDTNVTQDVCCSEEPSFGQCINVSPPTLFLPKATSTPVLPLLVVFSQPASRDVYCPFDASVAAHVCLLSVATEGGDAGPTAAPAVCQAVGELACELQLNLGSVDGRFVVMLDPAGLEPLCNATNAQLVAVQVSDHGHFPTGTPTHAPSTPGRCSWILRRPRCPTSA